MKPLWLSPNLSDTLRLPAGTLSRGPLTRPWMLPPSEIERASLLGRRVSWLADNGPKGLKLGEPASSRAWSGAAFTPMPVSVRLSEWS